MADDSLCTRCGKTAIAACGGRGYVRVDDSTVQPCKNIYLKQLMLHLGSEIANVRHVDETPLLRLRPGGGEPLVDLTTKNIRIQSTWKGLLPHLKYVFTFKGLMFVRQVITDERIRNVFVGSESYKARSQRVRDDLETFNSLADLVRADYHLVIIKLGYLGYKNQAAAGALKETLLTRASIGKPTWIVLDPDRSWDHSRDGDVEEYIDGHFEDLVLESEGSGEPQPRGVGMPSLEEQMASNDDDDEAPNELGQLVTEEDLAEVSTGTALGGDFDLPGEGQPKKWKKGRY